MPEFAFAIMDFVEKNLSPKDKVKIIEIGAAPGILRPVFMNFAMAQEDLSIFNLHSAAHGRVLGLNSDIDWEYVGLGSSLSGSCVDFEEGITRIIRESPGVHCIVVSVFVRPELFSLPMFAQSINGGFSLEKFGPGRVDLLSFDYYYPKKITRECIGVPNNMRLIPGEIYMSHDNIPVQHLENSNGLWNWQGIEK